MKKTILLIVSMMISSQSFAGIYDCTNSSNPNEFGSNTPVNVSFSTGTFTHNVTDARFSLAGRYDESKYEETNCTREKDSATVCYPLNVQSPVRSIVFHKVFGAMVVFKNVEGASLLECQTRLHPVVK